MSYNAKVYMEQGAATQVVDDGGEIRINSGGKITSAGVQASAITDASVEHALNSTFSDTEVEDALDALGAKINSIIAALEGAGIIAS